MTLDTIDPIDPMDPMDDDEDIDITEPRSQYYYVKFCYLLEYTVDQTYSNIVQVIGDKAVSRETVADWVEKLKQGIILYQDSSNP